MIEHLYGGRITLYPPTPKRKQWRIMYEDANGTKKFKSGGTTREEARARAAETAGISTPLNTQDPTAAPTAHKAFDMWLKTRQPYLNSRTVDNYRFSFESRSTNLLNVQINRLTPELLSTVDTRGLARDTQKKVRSIWRQTLEHHRQWLQFTPETLVSQIHLDGTRRSDSKLQVDRRVIPSLPYANTLIATAWSTENSTMLNHPLNTNTMGWTFTEPQFKGLPDEYVTRKMRHTKAHYTKPEAFIQAERQRVGREFQSAAIISALGVGALMRIGEILALRIRHFIDDGAIRQLANPIPDYLINDPAHLYDVINQMFTGRIQIDEQASQASAGRIVISLPKSGRPRTTHMPSFLPTMRNGDIYTPERRNPHRYSKNEAITAWLKDGTPAIRMMIVSHLTDLIHQWHTNRPDDITPQNIKNTMLFPTAAKMRNEPKIIDSLTGYFLECPLTGGGYRSQTNYAGRIANPLYDYTSATMHEYPSINANTNKRSGFTHHGMRHLGISLQLKRQRPIIDISADAGHKHAGFTLQRYGHLIRDADARFEF